ncbi:MAG: glycosyltransferase [bacterium]
MKIAIAHDYLNQFGGAERVVEVMHEIFPQAPIYTSIYLPSKLPASFKKMDIRTSFMQRLPFLGKHFKKYLFLYPVAFESFDLSDYDVVLSSSSAFAKGIRKGADACHICYCYSPMRFVWRYEDYIEKEDYNLLVRLILPGLLKGMKKWDLKTNKNVDYFIAISNYIAKRIEDLYNVKSEVIYPPVNVTAFSPSENISDYFLVVSRLNAYKKVDIAIKAFNELGLPLKIIGEGPYKRKLMAMAGRNIEFLGKVSDKELPDYYARCRAFIFPGEEDFGITPVESQAAGRPVIAYGSGGALETVLDDKTGVFFNKKNEHSLADAIKRFLKMDFDAIMIRDNALKFDKEIFKTRIRSFVEQKYKRFVDAKRS